MPSNCSICGDVSAGSSPRIFHLAPRDETTRNKWREKCGKDKIWNPKTFYICSDHFNEDSYKRDLRNELLNLPPRKLLKEGAIPSVGLPNSSVPASSPSPSPLPLPPTSVPFHFTHPHKKISSQL